MFASVTRVVVVLALLCSLGGNWHGLQVLAWAKMIQERAPLMGISNAIESVVDGGTPCEICLIIQAKRAEQRQSPVGLDAKPLKIPAFIVPRAPAVVPPAPTRLPASVPRVGSPDLMGSEPPSPPPRFV